MTEKQKEMADALGLSQEKAEEMVKELHLPSTESEEDAPTQDKFLGFQFPSGLVELFNAASRLNALFDRQSDVEYERWCEYGEDPDTFYTSFAEAREHCTKIVEELSQYAKALVMEEMFEKYKD